MVHVTYSFEILRPLQQAILARGDQVAWFLYKVDPAFLKEDEHHLASVDEVLEYNPSAVFLPGNWVPRFFPGAKVQIFHGLANDETGKKGIIAFAACLTFTAPTLNRSPTNLNSWPTRWVTSAW